MTIRTDWQTNGAGVMTLRFDPQWTWEALIDAGAFVRAKASSASGPVHVIYELRDSDAIVKSPLLQMRAFATQLPKNVHSGLHVFVDASHFWRVCMTMFTAVYPEFALDTVFVSDLSSALEAIARKREQLPQV